MPAAAWGIVGDEGAIGQFDEALTDWPEAWEDYGSYGGSGWISNPLPTEMPFDNPDHAKYWRTPDIRGGDVVPMILDCLFIGDFIDGLGDLVPPQWVGDYFNSGIQLFCIDRHDRTVNSLFLDWSARKVDLKELWTLRWHRQFDIQNMYTIAGGMTRSEWEQRASWMADLKDY